MENKQEFKISMQEAQTEIISAMEMKVIKACLLIEAEAKKKCPVDEGRLRASITHETKRNEKEIVGLVGTNVEYAPYVEYGTGIHAKNGKGRKTPWKWQGHSKKYKGFHITRGQKPQPFLEPSVTENLEKIKKILLS